MGSTEEKMVSYKYLCFDHSKFTEKIFNGNPNATKRCRFCGKILDSSHYTKEAHAISVSLGNTKFFCADECDSCNAWFGRYLESDVVNFFQVSLSLYRVSKRNGDDRVIAGRNFDMTMSDNNEFQSDLPLLKIHMRDWKEGELPITIENGYKTELDLTNKTFVPQNVYKALCKYALSLMPHSVTTRFQPTIDWIKGNKIATELPTLKMAFIDRGRNDPFIKLHFRDSDENTFPFCIVSMIIANCHILYTLPFCMEKSEEINTKEQFKLFADTYIKESETSRVFETVDFSNSNRTGFKVDLDLKFENGATMYKMQKSDDGKSWITSKNQ